MVAQGAIPKLDLYPGRQEDTWGAPSALDPPDMPATSQSSYPQKINQLKSDQPLWHDTQRRAARMEQNWGPTSAKRKNRGRVNTIEPPELNPLLRWPNENIPLNIDAKRPSFEDLSQPQFAAGFLANVLQVKGEETKELMKIFNIAHTSG